MVIKLNHTMALSASLLVFASLAVVLSRHSHSRSVGPGSTAPVDVDVAAVISTTVTDYQDYSGRTEAINRVEIRPLVSGTIVGVHFADGALVKRGDLLFTIDPRPFVAEVDRASAELAAARARDGYASTDAVRAQRLLTDNAIAKRDYDRAQNTARESAANVLSAQAALERAKVNLTYTTIVAPVTGRVSRAERTLGNVVSSGGADAPVLTTLVSLAPIYASFDVDEQTYLRYLSRRDGSSIPVSLGLANEAGFSREGKIDSVDNQMDTSSGTIRVRAIFDNADYSLVPGLYARIKVGGGTPHAAVLVQTAAVGTDQDKTFVLVVNRSNRILYREVAIESERDGLSVVKSGLSPGERIVVGGVQRVKANDLVRPHEVAMAASVNASHSPSQS